MIYTVDFEHSSGFKDINTVSTISFMYELIQMHVDIWMTCMHGQDRHAVCNSRHFDKSIYFGKIDTYRFGLESYCTY